MTVSEDVLIVGAGPVGLTASCLLAREGVSVRVVEALEQPTTQSRAAGVHARNLELFASLGVLPRLESQGRRMTAIEMLDGRTGSRRARVPLGELASRHPYILDVSQPDTEAVLATRAKELGVVIDRGVTVIGLTQDDGGVDVTMRSDGGEHTARVGWVVGADGGHSKTRDLVGAQLKGSFHGQHFVMADCDIDTSLSPDTIRMFTHPDGMGMVFPLSGKRARIGFFIEPPTASAPTLDEIQRLADERTGGQYELSDPGWLSYFEVHHGQIDQYRHGRVLLAGDAAHIHSPAGGQGMNTGIGDAANLAWKLALVARGAAKPELLDSYHDERHPIGAAVVRGTTKMTDIGTASGPEAAIRNLALFLVGHVHRLGQVGATALSEVSINYRDSALSVHHGPRRPKTARPGSHAPDPVGLSRPDGTPVAVEELLARPGFLVLCRTENSGSLDALRGVLGNLGTVVAVVSGTSAASTDDDRVVDPDDAIGRHYGLAREGIAVIRPDGYLGLVSTDSADASLLKRYLEETLSLSERAAV